MIGKVGMRGSLKMRVRRAPGPGLLWKLRNFPKLLPGLFKFYVASVFKIASMHGRLRARLIRANGMVINYGLISTRLVTTAFVNFVVDQLITESTIFGDYKYHDSGVGVTAANVSDVDIETTDGESRVAGTQVEDAANIYESVGTIAYTTTKAITEHGLFNASTGVTLMDRHVFSALNVENGDSIEFTYDLTVTAGG